MSNAQSDFGADCRRRHRRGCVRRRESPCAARDPKTAFGRYQRPARQYAVTCRRLSLPRFRGQFVVGDPRRAGGERLRANGEHASGDGDGRMRFAGFGGRSTGVAGHRGLVPGRKTVFRPEPKRLTHDGCGGGKPENPTAPPLAPKPADPRHNSWRPPSQTSQPSHLEYLVRCPHLFPRCPSRAPKRNQKPSASSRLLPTPVSGVDQF